MTARPLAKIALFVMAVAACSAHPASDMSGTSDGGAFAGEGSGEGGSSQGGPAASADAGAAPGSVDAAGTVDAAADLDASSVNACAPVSTGKPLPSPSTGLYVESFAGAVTTNEVASFKSFIAALTPAADNIANNWAQHQSGQQTKAMGMLYAIARDVAILDRMIVFCDALLSERNDLAPAPVGQHVLWTGGIDPAWPNVTTTPIGTAGEQGDPIGHLGNCARLILETPAIWSQSVGPGDPHGYGATYLARAKRYVKEADVAVDGHILKSLLDVSDQNRQRFAVSTPQGAGMVPWNQQMMFNYGFENLAAAHAILTDDPARVARYEGLVQSSMDWFFKGGGATTTTDAKGNASYFWGYSGPGTTEDNSHGSLDVDGFFLAYASGHYGVTAAMMAPLANTYLDIMARGATDYAGKVDGTDGGGNSAPTTYIRSGWLLLSEFRPGTFVTMMTGGRLAEGKTTTTIDAFARFAWLKTRRCLAGQTP